MLRGKVDRPSLQTRKDAGSEVVVAVVVVVGVVVVGVVVVVVVVVVVAVAARHTCASTEKQSQSA